jgi:hypothetical protein
LWKDFQANPSFICTGVPFLSVFEINVKKNSAYLKTNISLLVVKQVLVVNFDAYSPFFKNIATLFRL